jgi:rieske iron-sulfur protein
MHEDPNPPCGCGGGGPADTPIRRRQVIRIGAATGAAVALGPLGALPAAARPAAGDLLVLDDVETDPVAIKAADVQAGKPVLAFPFDPASKQIRNDSKLNKIVLVRVAEADLDADSKARAAGGVLAFSVVCTHQACEAKTWTAADKALACFCHASKFLVLEGGRVASGPAPRALPMLPLKLQGDQLAVAGPFTSPPGGATN